ncbi:MAG: SUMF1/EgtB/PvdO family nonheme iron enzyme [Candidatus Nitrotoga sp.]|nr:SUMF1/EgtB/PvdO family nonheme iron enzyme [Candidatus Nitrotoga sp.]
MSLDEIIEKWRPSMVFISVEAENSTGAIISSSGSGFIISSKGYVLTAGHVIPISSKRKITGSPESRHGTGEEMDYIGHDPISDFALLKFRNTAIKRTPVQFGNPESLRYGSELSALGFPLHTEFSAKSGRLNGGGPDGTWITDIALNLGDSGGPVFNYQGQVVAMVASALKEAEGIKYLLPISFAGFLLKRGEAHFLDMPSFPILATPIDESPKVPVAGTIIKDCDTCPEMVVIPAGQFMMGSSADKQSNEYPAHKVNIDAFLMSKTEITQGQWRTLMGKNPSLFNDCGDDCPVDRVSWDDAQEFVQKFNQKTGKQYRLPSEAEWEYACRAGGQHEYCGSDNLDKVAWYKNNSGEVGSLPVRLKQPNAFGLFDMSGNVSEWVEDSYHDSYRSGAPKNGSVWQGDTKIRVLRGGGWNDPAPSARAANRNWAVATDGYYFTGFRLARGIQANEDTFSRIETLSSEILTKGSKEVSAKLRVDAKHGNIIIKDCNFCPEIVVIPSGQFEMGSSKADPNVKPRNIVNVDTFALGMTEITQGQWRTVMGTNPSHNSLCGDDCPVENVSWDDAQAYIMKLNAKTGMQYRLPNEAEWEYACRTGGRHRFCGTDNSENVWGAINDVDSYTTHPVSRKQPNAHGLYDMSGNVAEWTEDNYNSGDVTPGFVQPGDGPKRVIRSGTCLNGSIGNDKCDYDRGALERTFRFKFLGFRIARNLNASKDIHMHVKSQSMK